MTTIPRRWRDVPLEQRIDHDVVALAVYARNLKPLLERCCAGDDGRSCGAARRVIALRRRYPPRFAPCVGPPSHPDGMCADHTQVLDVIQPSTRVLARVRHQLRGNGIRSVADLRQLLTHWPNTFSDRVALRRRDDGLYWRYYNLSKDRRRLCEHALAAGQAEPWFQLASDPPSADSLVNSLDARSSSGA